MDIIKNIICEINLARVLLMLALIINIIFAFIMIKDIKELKKVKELAKGSKNKKFFLEIPDEANATPARALCIDGSGSEIQECRCVFAATVFDLCLKGIVNIEIAANNEIKFSINDVPEVESLSEDEKNVYEILESSIGSKEGISLDNLQQYAETTENSGYVYNKIRDMIPSACNYAEKICSEKTLDKKFLKFHQRRYYIYSIILIIITFLFCYCAKANISLVCAMIIATIVFCPIFYIELCVGCSISQKIAKNFYKTGNIIKFPKMWSGFRRYLTNYSKVNSAKDKKIDIKQIEKYLVYAATFDISLSFMEELKILYPDIFENYTDQNNGDRYDKFWKEICMTKIGEISTFEYIEGRLHDIYNWARKASL